MKTSHGVAPKKLWAALHFWLARRTLSRDLEAAKG